MNVSMMDAYNLSWKLAHSILGLTPRTAEGAPDPVLETFDQERVDTARQLIDFDKKFSHMFSGQIGAQDSSAQGLSQTEFQSIFSQGSGFTSGCGLHYRTSTIVDDHQVAGSIQALAGDSQSTHLTIGRRMLNVELKRYADGSIRQLHDGMSFALPIPTHRLTHIHQKLAPLAGTRSCYLPATICLTQTESHRRRCVLQQE